MPGGRAVTPAFLVDMNLSPDWLPLLEAAGFPALHWVTVGLRSSPDAEIMAWAKDNGRTILTHDLDFGTLLALTQADSPSVVLIRGHDVLPDRRGPQVIAALGRHHQALIDGALVVVDVDRSRVRVLPLKPPPGPGE